VDEIAIHSDADAVPSIKPVVMFLTYQRTTFTDAFRLALRLKTHGAYEPVFLVAAGTDALLEKEIHQCRANGIRCLLESDVIAARKAGTVEQVVAQSAATPVESRLTKLGGRARALALKAVQSLQWRAFGRTFTAAQLRVAVQARMSNAVQRIRWLAYD